jgi:hypothetical protein
MVVVVVMVMVIVFGHGSKDKRNVRSVSRVGAFAARLCAIAR